MKKLLFLTIILIGAASIGLQSQTLVNVITIEPLNLEIDGKVADYINSGGIMIIPSNESKVMLYQNNDLTYWAEFKFKQCGKKASLSSKTYVELKDGSIIDGSSKKEKRKVEKGEQNWIVGFYNDTFEKDIAFKADFEYNMQFKN